MTVRWPPEPWKYIKTFSKTTGKRNRFLFHCCNVLFHHHFLLQSKARLSKIIPAFQVPRNLVYERDPSAVWMVMSTDVLGCSVRRCIFSHWMCVWKHWKWLFFVPYPAAIVSSCGTVVQTALKLQKNTSDWGENYSCSCAKLTLCLSVHCAIICYAVIDLQCRASWPCKKYADWSACLTWEIVWKLEIVPFFRYILQHRTIFWKEKLKVSLRPEKKLHTITEFMNKMTDKHTNKKTGALFCGN